MDKRQSYTWLMYAGTLPFLACAILPFVGITHLPQLGTFEEVAAVYALVIATFMAGTHWGLYLGCDKNSPENLFIHSNIITVVLFFTFLLANDRVILLVSIVAFLYLLVRDYTLQKKSVLSQHYWRSRCYVTAIVCLSLVVTVVMS